MYSLSNVETNQVLFSFQKKKLCLKWHFLNEEIREKSRPQFILDMYAKRLPRYRSFQVEITRFNVIAGFLLEEEAVDLYFNCESVLLDEDNLLFSWSNISKIWPNADFKPSKFCTGIFENIDDEFL
jgi:hypothetical protein